MGFISETSRANLCKSFLKNITNYLFCCCIESNMTSCQLKFNATIKVIMHKRFICMHLYKQKPYCILMQTTQAEQEYTGTTLDIFFFFSVLIIQRIRSGEGNEPFSNNPASKIRPTYLPH